MPDASHPRKLTHDQLQFNPALNYAAERERLLKLAASLRDADWVELANDQGFALVALDEGIARDRVLARIIPEDSRPLYGMTPHRRWRCEVYGFHGSGRPGFARAKVLAHATRSDVNKAREWIAEQVWVHWADQVWRSLNGRPTAFADLSTIGQPLHREKAKLPAA